MCWHHPEWSSSDPFLWSELCILVWKDLRNEWKSNARQCIFVVQPERLGLRQVHAEPGLSLRSRFLAKQLFPAALAPFPSIQRLPEDTVQILNAIIKSQITYRMFCKKSLLLKCDWPADISARLHSHLFFGLGQPVDKLLTHEVVLSTHFLAAPLPVQLHLHTLLLQTLFPLNCTGQLLLIPESSTQGLFVHFIYNTVKCFL